VINEVLNSYSMSLDYLRSLVEDIPDDQLASQPGGMVNHPLWTIGHLVFSAQMIGGDLGVSPWLTEDWQQRYGTGSTPVPERTAYPGSESLLQQLADAEHRLRERLILLDNNAMKQAFPVPQYRHIFPTTGHAVIHVIAAHTAAHVGQVIVWRRLMGLAPLSRVFE
jgi:hypothetical protein